MSGRIPNERWPDSGPRGTVQEKAGKPKENGPAGEGNEGAVAFGEPRREAGGFGASREIGRRSQGDIHMDESLPGKPGGVKGSKARDGRDASHDQAIRLAGIGV